MDIERYKKEATASLPSNFPRHRQEISQLGIEDMDTDKKWTDHDIWIHWFRPVTETCDQLKSMELSQDLESTDQILIEFTL